MSPSPLKLSRRRLLRQALALAAGAGLARAGAEHVLAELLPDAGPHHLVWLWQFSEDGAPDAIGARLRDAGLGIVVKTHDGTNWMAKYDSSPYAVSGPSQVTILAGYYEAAAVPFHAWCVLQGVDPVAEAGMAAQVLAAGARSLYLDVDMEFGAWKGTPADAATFGRELRRLQPDAQVVLSVDTRPWQLRRLPLRECAGFCDAVAIKLFWRVYDTAADRAGFEKEGLTLPPEGPSPEFLVAACEPLVSPLGVPLQYIGEGDAPLDEVRRFVDTSLRLGAPFAGVWRAGIMQDPVYGLLRDRPPMPPAPPPAAAPLPPAAAPSQTPPPAAPRTYSVQPGDTLSQIAEKHGVSVAVLSEVNHLADPDMLRIGQELVIP